VNDRNLPIKIIQKRKEIDERLTEPGGGDMLPKWVLQEDSLQAKSLQLSQNIRSVERGLEAKFQKYSSVPAVITARVVEDALAKSHRKEFVGALSPKENKIIGFSDNRELLIEVDDLQQLKRVDQQFKDLDKNPKAISGVESFDLFRPRIEIDQVPKNNAGEYVLKVRLIMFRSYQQNEKVLSAFTELLQASHFKLKRRVRYAENVEILHVTTNDLQTVNDISDFSALMSIQPMPTIDVGGDDFFKEESIEVPTPIGGTTYPTVGILDSGIAPIAQLNPWLPGKRYTSYPEHFLAEEHGTFVAGIVGFGDLLQNQHYTGVRGCNLLDAAIYPNPNLEKLYEDDLVENIREAVSKHSQSVKIWNLSLGFETEAQSDDFSDFGIALDQIQDEFNVIIVKSAGNCRNFLSNKPNARIAIGADSVRAIVVGSIAHERPFDGMASPDSLSPFSRVGPGPANIIKPDLVHYGGNASGKNGQLIKHGVKSFGVQGEMVRDIGTSFSAPRVSSILADLDHRVNEEFDPVLLKALLLHSARYPDACDLPNYERLNQMGFGIPRPAEETLHNDSFEITLVLRDSLDKGEFVEILDFPYPTSLVDADGFYLGQVVVTVVNHPVLKAGQASEYCQSNLEVKLGTYSGKFQRDTSKQTVRNPFGRLEPFNILLSSKYSKRKPLARGIWASERMLVTYGDKFYPNKKYAVDLSELTAANKEKYTKAPKKWFLKVEGLYRAFVEETAELERADLAQEYCIVITIRDPAHQSRVYDEVVRQLQSNNFIHRNIKIVQTVDISPPIGGK